MSEPIKPDDIKPGDWVRHDTWGYDEIAIVEEVLPPVFPEHRPVIVTTDVRLWPTDVLEVRRG